MLPRLFTALCLVIPSVIAQGEAVSLRPHWEPGQSWRQETSTDTSTPSAQAGKMEQTLHVVQNTLMQVAEDAAAKQRLVGVTFVSVQGEIRAGDQVLRYDSSSPEKQNPMLHQAFGQAVGKKFTLVYDDADRFLDVRDMMSLSSSPTAMTSLSAVADARNVALLFRKSLELGLPKLPVSVGDTWTIDETMSFPKAGEVRVQMNGKLAAIELMDGRKHARVVFEGKFGNTAARPDRPVAMMEITSDSSISGVLYFDLERRVVSVSTSTTKIKLQSPEQTVPFEQKMVSKMTAVTK